MADERDLHALGEALAADLGGALFAGLVGSPAAPDHWPGRAGGWSDDDPANVDDDVPFVDVGTRPDRGKLTLGGVLADSHARHAAALARSREDAIAEVLHRWRDGEDLDPGEQARVDNLLAVAPDGWSTILAERTRIRRRARIRARREHAVGLHCAGCHPWHD